MSTSRWVITLGAMLFVALPGTAGEDPNQALAAATLKQMEMIGTGIEAYITDYNAPPQVTTMEDLKKALVGTYLKDVPLRDPWDRPYHYEGAGKVYRLVSSGSDGKFEPAAKWDDKKLLTDTAADAVFSNGAFTRKWDFDNGASARIEANAVAQLTAEHKAKLQKLPDEKQMPFTWMTITRLGMRSIANAIERYTAANGHVPQAASMDELKGALYPKYIDSIDTSDAWGTPFRYSPSTDGRSYTLVSAGSDKVFKPESWKQTAKLTSYADDAVIADGKWVREWKDPE